LTMMLLSLGAGQQAKKQQFKLQKQANVLPL
jgi:hypothetical protein